MYDFSNLKKLHIADKPAVYELSELEGCPKLYLRFAGERNKPYFNAVLKQATKTARLLKGTGMTAEILKKNRQLDLSLFPKHVVTGWDGIVDTAGTPVPFSPEACEALLEALPEWLFDRIRAWAADESNFTEAAVADVDELVGN